ncbi:site-specific integrase [Methylocella sp.]|jgi:integrase|uniref:site-specific integrase n=1 Tax=Methylocella sp. TaxID=1978226 RepID=UPI003C24C555
MTRERSFIDACEFPHIKLFAILAFATGGRMSAILQLTWDRIDFERGEIQLRDPTRLKTNKGRANPPMNDMVRAELLGAKQAATTPFVIEWGGHRVLSVKKGLAAVGKRCGLPWVTAHVFRHSAACAMAEAGVPMAEIAQFLGHSDSRVTERHYARFSPKYLRTAAAALNL